MKKHLVAATLCTVLGAHPAPAETFEARADAEATVDRIIATVRKDVSDPDAPFRLIVRLRARPDSLDDVLASYARQRAVAEENPGSLVYQVSQVSGDATALVLYEDWANLRAFIAHETSEETIAHFTRVGPLLEAERSLAVAFPALTSAPD